MLETNEIVVSVCRSVVEEIDSVIQKVDPKRTMEVGSYRLDSKGNQKQKTVSSCIQLSVQYYILIHPFSYMAFLNYYRFFELLSVLQILGGMKGDRQLHV